MLGRPEGVEMCGMPHAKGCACRVPNAQIALIDVDSLGRPCDTPQYHPPPTGTTKRFLSTRLRDCARPEGTVFRTADYCVTLISKAVLTPTAAA